MEGSGAEILKEIQDTNLEWKDTELGKVEKNNFEVDLDVDGDAEEFANGWVFLAEPKLEGFDDDVCEKSDYIKEEIFQYFADGV